ncbi:MAG: helix-turn-helix domain-containing protein [Candidatus Lokiarchaeota archaeon]|nr:helix-turn-helix domain-containing protein [Candidatus Lokiarchaeota archaeon]
MVSISTKFRFHKKRKRNELISIIEILHYQIDKIIEEIKTHPSVYEFNIVNLEENRVRINVKTKNPYLLFAVIKCGVIIDFPVKVRDKFAIWNLISTRKRIDDLLKLFEKEDINFSLLKIGSSQYSFERDKNKLSVKESKILDTAIDLGFFEVPRKISLEMLANNLGKSKSWTSEQLRKIIKKKIKFGI